LIAVAPNVPVPVSMAPPLTVAAELAIEPLTTSVPAYRGGAASLLA
jgi:hypothetical protein